MGEVTKILENKLTEDEIKSVKEDVELTAKALHSLQASIKKEVDRIMEEQHIGFNELARRLKITSRMTSQLLNGGNFTLETITKLSKINKKTPHIIWK